MVQTLDSGWDGDGDGDGEIYTGMGMGNFLWGRGGDGENFMGTGWGWGKFYGDGAGMGTILFTVSLSKPDRHQTCTRWSPGKPTSRVCSKLRLR